MRTLLLVGAGGFIGSVLRYVVSTRVQHWTGPGDFPYGTLVVNVVGCLIIGFLGQWAEARGVFSPTTRAFVFVGVLGGFTTFSAFGNETIHLWRGGLNALALVNVTAQLALGLGAVWTGRAVAQLLWR